MKQASETRRIDLGQPLPSAVAVGGPRSWFAYRRYPVFSLPWLWRRSLIFLTVIGLAAGLGALSHYTQSGDWAGALWFAGIFMLGFLGITTGGPALATLARTQAAGSRWERWLVSLAVVAGLLMAGLFDMWTSGELQAAMDSDPTHSLSPTALTINVLILLGIYSVIGGGVALLAYFGERQRLNRHLERATLRRLQQEKLEADQRLSLLQAQVEPHFLFNTLAAARSLTGDSPQRAAAMLDALSDYLRAAIPRLRSGEPGVDSRLGEQLTLCAHYLEVMAQRHGDRLQWQITVPDALASLPFPPFVLISLVENAVRHGIEPKPAGGRIHVEASRDAGELQVTVSDDGMGLATGMVMGVGLANVREQLQNRHGSAARLTLSSPASGGTRACVTVPLEASEMADD